MRRTAIGPASFLLLHVPRLQRSRGSRSSRSSRRTSKRVVANQNRLDDLGRPLGDQTNANSCQSTAIGFSCQLTFQADTRLPETISSPISRFGTPCKSQRFSFSSPNSSADLDTRRQPGAARQPWPQRKPLWRLAADTSNQVEGRRDGEHHRRVDDPAVGATPARGRRAQGGGCDAAALGMSTREAAPSRARARASPRRSRIRHCGQPPRRSRPRRPLRL